MAANWMRRTALVAACASAMLLAACGSSTTESAITPDRFIAFGDAHSDIGQKGTRYTVNNGSVNNWTLQLVSHYQKTLAPVSSGGLSYAQGNARIAAQPDAAGEASTPTITAQIDSFLASKTFAANDVVLLNGGISDLIVGMAAVQAGTLSSAAYLDQAHANGQALAAQVRRLVAAGAPHILMTGTYDLGKTPWATAIGQTELLSQASTRFNEAVLVAINDLGQNVLFVDSAYYVNIFTSAGSAYSFTNAKAAVCTSVDAGNGIGTGTGQVNSALCTASTLLAGANADQYVFADNVYLSPSAQRQLGTFMYDKLRARW
ncbi:SGNH/GDSL hydrolase family protein [Simplicispira lacusdiani]|uniref:SGNH/GDSL hydrolase family protein n=1 Tax=Simplicispira lacusdiani TaxID=2213010 RepID=UPI000E761D22|nr:SGNH/GDSL hydrolase family protein [Simplicispira lacusdiani]